MKGKRFWLSMLSLIALIAALLFPTQPAAGDSYKYYATKLSQPSSASDFTLTGPDGKPYSLKSLHGKFALIAFGFTHCPNTCPTTLANLASAYEQLSRAAQARVQVLFISIDPKRDTPAVMNAYVPFFDKHFIGLTGTAEQIARIAGRYEVEYEKSQDWAGDAGNYTLDHSAGAMLLSPSGDLIGNYRDEQLIQSGRVADDLRHFAALTDFKNSDWVSGQGGVIKTPVLTGEQIYQRQCAVCHGVKGEGVKGKYPALAGSPWVTGPPNRFTALVLDGVRKKGEDKQTHGVMPAWWRTLPPSDLSLVLTYVRQAWGNNASAISTSYVQKLGYRYASRPRFWSLKELKALPPDKPSDAAD